MISNESPVAYKSLSLKNRSFSPSLICSIFLMFGFHQSHLCTASSAVAARGSIAQHLMDFSPHPATDLALKRAIKTTFNHENNRLFLAGKAEQLVLHINSIKLHCLTPKMCNVTVLIIICRTAIIDRIFWLHDRRQGCDPNADRQMDEALKWFYLAVRQQHKRKLWNYTIKREPNQQTSTRRGTKPNREPIKSHQNKHWHDI